MSVALRMRTGYTGGLRSCGDYGNYGAAFTFFFFFYPLSTNMAAHVVLLLLLPNR